MWGRTLTTLYEMSLITCWWASWIGWNMRMHRSIWSIRALARSTSCAHLRSIESFVISARKCCVEVFSFRRLSILITPRRSWKSIHESSWIIFEEFHHVFPLRVIFGCNFCLQTIFSSLSWTIFFRFKEALLGILPLLFFNEALELFGINETILQLLTSVVDSKSVIALLFISNKSIQHFDW